MKRPVFRLTCALAVLALMACGAYALSSGDSLKEEIGEILGINQGHTIVVLGTGNLGRALI